MKSGTAEARQRRNKGTARTQQRCGGDATKARQRHSRSAAETQQRHSRDTAEARRRHSKDTTKTQQKRSRDTAEVQRGHNKGAAAPNANTDGAPVSPYRKKSSSGREDSRPDAILKTGLCKKSFYRSSRPGRNGPDSSPDETDRKKTDRKKTDRKKRTGKKRTGKNGPEKTDRKKRTGKNGPDGNPDSSGAPYSYCPDLSRSTSSRVRKRHAPRLRFFFVRPA